MSSKARLRRLQNDYQKMMDLHQRNGLIYLIATDGTPPEQYVVGFRCQSVSKIDRAGHPILHEDHRIELLLTAEYPRVRPMMRWMTPIFHPNFSEQGDVCINEWYPQQTLVNLCEVLAELVQYKNYNTTSPLNMNAAMWAMQHRNELPIDNRNLHTHNTGQPPPIATSIHDASVVVTDRISIWSPPQASSRETTLVSFCEQCGFNFQDQAAAICPQCQTDPFKVVTQS